MDFCTWGEECGCRCVCDHKIQEGHGTQAKSPSIQTTTLNCKKNRTSSCRGIPVREQSIFDTILHRWRSRRTDNSFGNRGVSQGHSVPRFVAKPFGKRFGSIWRFFNSSLVHVAVPLCLVKVGSGTDQCLRVSTEIPHQVMHRHRL